MLNVIDPDSPPPLSIVQYSNNWYHSRILHYNLITGRNILLKTTMDQQGLATNRPPLFKEDNYAYWSVRMKCHLMSFGYKVWRSVEREYKVPDDLHIDIDELDQYEANAKALNAILSGLKNLVFVKFMQCKTAKHAWVKLKIVYEGVSKAKQSKL